jgi:hypothetical protein
VAVGGFVELDWGRERDESRVGNEIVNGWGYGEGGRGFGNWILQFDPLVCLKARIRSSGNEGCKKH